jgi:heme-degrading monooxygenase HmoA
MVIVLIRTTLRPEADRAAYDALNEQMFRLVQTMPGFIAADGYSSTDGNDVGVIRFESLETLRAWREHPDHLVVQQRGKTEFYAAYTIEVCEVVRAYGLAPEIPLAEAAGRANS